MRDDINTELLMAIGRVEGKIDGVVSSQIRHEDQLERHSVRILTLERWQSKVMAIWSVIVIAVSSAINWFFFK